MKSNPSLILRSMEQKAQLDWYDQQLLMAKQRYSQPLILQTH